MVKKKSSSGEKKRKHSQCDERHDNNGRKQATAAPEHEAKDDLADAELDRIGSDIEEGGLDLELPFNPISDYVTDKREMLKQCLHVLGEKKLRKMLPDELKDYSLEGIKELCWEQLEPISDNNLIQILAGEELSSGNGDENTEETMDSQQDNNVDSTSCIKETTKAEEPKQEVAVSGEESDVLSINADTYDSDIEGPKEEPAVKTAKLEVEEEEGGGVEPTDPPTEPAEAPQPAAPAAAPPAEAKKDIQSDIDRSVSEILAFSSSPGEEAAQEQSAPPPLPLPPPPPPPPLLPVSADVADAAQGKAHVQSGAPAACKPSIQQLELLELEMRARAIKALMKASDGKKILLEKST